MDDGRKRKLHAIEDDGEAWINPHLPTVVRRPSSVVRLQCGVDMVDISRIKEGVERWGERFLRRVWTEREIAYCRGRYPELAARFAAKEATSKALGTGMAGLLWREIEVLPDALGKPVLYLHGEAQARAVQLGLHAWAISLTHSREVACAFVVAAPVR